MSTDTLIRALILGVTMTGSAAAEAPLSAIDWLSDSVTEPAAPAAPLENDVTSGAAPEMISVQPLDAPRLDAVGLLSSEVTGLPRDAWADSAPQELARLIALEPALPLPAPTALLTTLLLAELDPPQGEAADGSLLLVRLDRLLSMGALEQAQALVERAGPTSPELFRRWFDVSLLTGHEDRACAALNAAPDVAPTIGAQVLCMARQGDWSAAILILDAAHALGNVADVEYNLMLRFLDPELFEGAPPLPLPQRTNPLDFRMREAIGEGLPTGSLPLAFAQADLRPNAGWKARIEAAERLTRVGAVDANRLLGIYTERKPAASGGVWDRVRVVQALDVALLGGNTQAVAKALPPAWAAMEAAELEVAFATLYGEKLIRLPLPDTAAALAWRIGLLGDGYESVAQARPGAAGHDALLAAVATGDVSGLPAADAQSASVIDGFSTPALETSLKNMLDHNRLGEAVLHALRLVGSGAMGDLPDMTQGLALLRAVGLEDAARRTALQFLILERRG